ATEITRDERIAVVINGDGFRDLDVTDQTVMAKAARLIKVGAVAADSNAELTGIRVTALVVGDDGDRSNADRKNSGRRRRRHVDRTTARAGTNGQSEGHVSSVVIGAINHDVGRAFESGKRRVREAMLKGANNGPTLVMGDQGEAELF